MSVTPGAAFAARLSDLLPDPMPGRIALAVSGGGDSMALMRLAAKFARGRSVEFHVLTVDHQSRPETAAEARGVAAAARDLGLAHQTLVWGGWTGQGNFQESARIARRSLIETWCIDHGVDHVLTGHTADDQAETILLRLARGSGVDGLAGMASRERHGILWLRPLLGVSRKALRDYLRDRGQGWADDPSNDDPKYDRIRARQMMDQLATLGLTRDRLLQTAQHMAAARQTLTACAVEFCQNNVRQDRGDLILSPLALDLDHGDTARRVLADAIRWIGQSAHRPRFDSLCKAASALTTGKRVTLQGVLMTPERDGFRLSREPAAVAGVKTVPVDGTARWDGRWIVTGPTNLSGVTDLTVRALGEAGLTQCPDWRDSHLPRMSVLASPAIWCGKELIAAPVALRQNGWTARNDVDFAQMLLSH